MSTSAYGSSSAAGKARLRRLRTRPAAGADEDGALVDAAGLRALGLPILGNDGISLDAAVDVVARWAQTQLSVPA